MSERTFWNYLRKGMRQRWEVVRIENTCSRGTPDTAYSMDGVHGWIELKFEKEWPKRESTKLRLAHFTPEQKIFIRKHGTAGGRCFLFLRVGSDFLLFEHVHILQLGELNKTEMKKKALKVWYKNLNFDELTEYLTC